MRLCHTNTPFFLVKKKAAPSEAVIRMDSHSSVPVCRRSVPPRKVSVEQCDQQNGAAEGLVDRAQGFNGFAVCSAFHMERMIVEKAQPIRRRHDPNQYDIEPTEQHINIYRH